MTTTTIEGRWETMTMMHKKTVQFLYHNGFTKDASKYEAERRAARKEHNVNEGDLVYVMRPSFNKGDILEEYKCTVEAISKHFITLRYKFGFCETMNWDEFDKSVSY